MKQRKKIIAALITIVVLVIVIGLFQKLLMPKYMSGVIEGAMIPEYYVEQKDHDVIFVGDCELYENISPIILWQEYGINSFHRGSAQQLIWQSYYLMEETVIYEKPDIIVFNVLSMKYDEPQKEEYNRMTIDNMRWSTSKVKDIFASMTEDENIIEYIFPILRYHSRWSDLSSDDIEYFWQKDTITYNGYYMRVDTLPAENVPTGKILSDYQFGDRAYYYLDKMVALCEENDIELVLVKAPSLYPYWYDEWDEQMEEYAKENDLKYYNFLENIDEIGLDYSTDTYDAGLHLNVSGAEKMAYYFGNILQTEYQLQNRRGEVQLEEIWDSKIIAYEIEKRRQYKALEDN